MKVTIVGGGFGGVKTALELAKSDTNQITLITDKPDFQYYPALYGAATGRSHLQSWVPLATIFADISNVEIVIDKITSIDSTKNELKSESGNHYTYQNCVMALGAVTTYFGIEGLDTYSYGIKSAAEIARLKKHLYDNLIEGNHVDRRYVIIGAGPTGVELAGAMGSYLRQISKKIKTSHSNIHIDLVEASERILPRMSPKASAIVTRRLRKLGVNSLTGKRVESADLNGIFVDGRPMTSHTVIWTSGVANHPFYAANSDHFKLASNGRVVVDQQLSAGPKNLYVIGDNAATPYTGMAQTALHDAIFVAGVLADVEAGRPPKNYNSMLPPVVVPVGSRWAMVEWRSIRVSGMVGALIRRAADFIGYTDVLPIGTALGAWRAGREKNQ